MSNDNENILDRVLQSQQQRAIQQFKPLDIVTELLAELSDKERDIVLRRFALSHDLKKRESLESIGQSYNLTRERIRQIEAEAVRKIKESKQLLAFLETVEATISALVEEHGGAMEEEHLLERVREIIGEDVAHRQSMIFIMDKLSDRYEQVTEEDHWLTGWKSTAVNLERLQEALTALIDLLKTEQRPMTFDEIHESMQKNPVYQKHAFDEKHLLTVLKLAKVVDENPYGEYGLAEWPEVRPRRMSDKIYIVLKKNKKPLHFVEIAEHINKAKFDHKRALPQTVHNELIIDERFVLIGRGIYALKEWGYAPGVVSDVITQVLKDAGRPLTKEEIIEQVLKRRVVKRATIYIALINKDKFKKNEDGSYELAA